DAAGEQLAPDAVDRRAGEERVVLRRHPRRQHLAAVLLLTYWHGGAVEVFRIERLATDRMARAGGDRLAEDDLFALSAAALSADRAEECGEAVIVLLHPLPEGVVVAAGAHQADAEEDLGGGLDGVLGRVEDAIIRRRRVAVGPALGGDQFADEAVIGLLAAI